MYEYTLNQIIQHESSWTCNVFEFDRINIGGIFLKNEEYDEMPVGVFADLHYRYYKKSKKIVISGSGLAPARYCALTFEFTEYLCLICKKLCRRNQKCLCNSYSICWSPINAQIAGLQYSDEFEFSYFEDEYDINIIL
jgi:hypothetical protein